jgi:hypothetical protein
MTRSACVLSACLLCLAAGTNRPADAGERTCAELVRQLGDDEFAAREQAEQELVRKGLAARPALLEGVRHADPEIRHRSHKALATIMRADLLARIAAFAADVEGTREHDLPGWKRFREIAGREATARELYAAMLRGEAELLELADSNPKRAAEQFGARAHQLQTLAFTPPRQVPPLANVAALLFVGSDPRLELPDDVLVPIYNFVNVLQTAFQPAKSGVKQGDVLRKLLAEWIVRRTEPSARYQSLNLALRFNLKEGLVPAWAEIRHGNRPNQIPLALLAIGKLGGPECLAPLLPLFENTEIGYSVQINGKTVKVEVRDVALAVAIHLTGQTHADYGFQNVQANPYSLYNLQSLGFEEDERRQAALKKWRLWAAANPEQLAPIEPVSSRPPREPTALLAERRLSL